MLPGDALKKKVCVGEKEREGGHGDGGESVHAETGDSVLTCKKEQGEGNKHDKGENDGEVMR